MAEAPTYTDLLYEEKDGIATITINRPEKLNAFRGITCDELIHAFNRAGWNKAIGVIVLTGAGTRAFCTGGDQSAHEGSYDGKGTVGLPMEALHNIIRGVPQPVIAKVRGYAIGGGNVLATLCDLTIAGESAQFGQVGPRWARSIPASAPPIWHAWSARRRRARSGTCAGATPRSEALAMGLVNKVVPDDQLDAEVDAWAHELAERSPTAIAIAKRSFNADTDHIAGIGALGMQALKLYYDSAESKEGVQSFLEKRKPDFRRYYK